MRKDCGHRPSVSATFTTLFERSRYSSQGRRFGIDDEVREKRMKQQERFAVGMIGFALEHDDKFKAHFLESVCGIKGIDARSRRLQLPYTIRSHDICCQDYERQETSE